MKIGLITIFDNNNLGNRLQNYAVQYLFETLGHSVCTIRNNSKKSRYRKLKNIFFLLGILQLPWLQRYVLHNRRKALFCEFNKNYLKTSRFCIDDRVDLSKIANKFDRWCVGSDQVWNPEIGRANRFEFLLFSEYDRNFSFSASFGVEKLTKADRERIKKGLNNIKYLSVREKEGKNIIKDLTGRNAEVLLDPTMMLNTEEWRRLEKKPVQIPDGKFMLLYNLGKVSEEREIFIEQFTNSHGYKKIDVLGNYFDFVGPSEFIWLIDHCEFVLTDSFHCTAFSILFRKNFYVFERNSENKPHMNSRLYTLLERFDSLERMLNEEELKEYNINKGELNKYKLNIKELKNYNLNKEDINEYNLNDEKLNEYNLNKGELKEYNSEKERLKQYKYENEDKRTFEKYQKILEEERKKGMKFIQIALQGK